MNKKMLISLAGGVLAFLPILVFAQGADPIVNCGDTEPCTLDDFWETIKKSYILFAEIATLIGFATFVFYAIKLGWAQDKAVAKADLKSKLLWIIGVTTLIWALPALFLAFLKAVGTDDQFINPLKGIANVIGVESAYAEEIIPSPISLEDGLPTFFLRLYDIFLRWFAFPAMIALWVYSAGLLVFAQGIPEKLKQARGWLWFTFVLTVILLFTRVFLEAVANSIKTIT